MGIEENADRLRLLPTLIKEVFVLPFFDFLGLVGFGVAGFTEFGDFLSETRLVGKALAGPFEKPWGCCQSFGVKNFDANGCAFAISFGFCLAMVYRCLFVKFVVVICVYSLA